MVDRRISVWVQRFKDRSTLVLQWIDPETGKRKSKSAETADKEKADKKRQDIEYELNHGMYSEPTRTTWKKFREQFEDEYVSALRTNTQRNHRNTLDLFEELCKPTRMSAINQRSISAFAAAMRKRPTRGRPGMMASSIAVRLQFLHTALEWAAGQNFMKEVPAFPKISVPEKDPQPVPAETFERLLAKAEDPVMYVYLLTGWLAGMRLEEASILEWEETTKAPYVHFAANRIVIPAEFTKGKKDTWLPLDPVLRAALEGLERHGKKVFHFYSRQGGYPLTMGGLSTRVVKLARKAGVRLTMHSLRRGFGCRYAGKVPAQVLQRLMRHRNIQTTMRYYANIDAAVEEAVLGPKGGQCNSLRNTPVGPADTANPSIDVKHSDDCTSTTSRPK